REARIVSLVPSITELVCDLGLAAQLVGRTGFCVHPRELVRRSPKVGGSKDVDLDKLRSLRATHVILNIDENRDEDARAIAGFVRELIVTHPLAPLGNPALYRLSGGLFRRADEAAALCGDTLLAQKRMALIDGEMTAWYGSRAIEGLRYLRRFREGLDRAAG